MKSIINKFTGCTFEHKTLVYMKVTTGSGGMSYYLLDETVEYIQWIHITDDETLTELELTQC